MWGLGFHIGKIRSVGARIQRAAWENKVPTLLGIRCHLKGQGSRKQTRKKLKFELWDPLYAPLPIITGILYIFANILHVYRTFKYMCLSTNIIVY